jgi:hypothetical protein
MILSDDVNGDDSIDDGTECDGDNVERREGDWNGEENATPDNYCRSEVDATDTVFIGMDKTQWGTVKSSTHIRRTWQNILTKLPAVISQARKAMTPFEA